MTAESLSKLSGLAFEYGPFFFSIFFLIVVSRWAYKNYLTARPQQADTLKKVFVISFATGTLLVFVSVAYWILNRPRMYLYQGKIEKLDINDNLESDNIFFRSVTHWSPGYPNPPRTAYFIIVEKNPFQKGQEYAVNLFRGQTNVELNPLKVKIDPADAEGHFTAECCDDHGKYYLTKRVDTPTEKSSLAVDTVYADSPRQEPEQARPKSKSKKPSLAVRKADQAAILQTRGVDIGLKLSVLQQMTQSDAPALKRLLDQPTDKEDPLVLTLLDFTRHSDRQVAFRSNQVLRKIDADDYVAARLASGDSPVVRAAERILLRVKQTEAKVIVSIAREKGWVAPKNLVREIESGEKTRLLVPTWTPSGEMYFVKAMWNPKNVQVQTCLRDLFHSELISAAGRTIAQEDQLMRQKNGVRYVYWDQQWALYIADKITACGGKFAFVHPGE